MPSVLVIEYLHKAVTNNIAKYVFMLLQGKLQLPLFHRTSLFPDATMDSFLFQTICQLFINHGQREAPKQTLPQHQFTQTTFSKATTMCEQKILGLSVIFSSSTLFKIIYFQQLPQQQKTPQANGDEPQYERTSVEKVALFSRNRTEKCLHIYFT